MQPVIGRPAAGGDGRGTGAGGRWENRPVIEEAPRTGGKVENRGAGVWADEIVAVSVADHEDDASHIRMWRGHDVTPLMAKSKMS